MAKEILHLTLKKQWFDMIASGEKLEEYREVKPYWINRLCWHEYHSLTPEEIIKRGDSSVCKNTFYDIVRFKNGYGKDVPTVDIECEYIQIGYGMSIWGAETGVEYFVISLGKILSNSEEEPERSVANSLNQGTNS